MDIANLTFIVTDDCNFRCSYCFQSREKQTIDNGTIKTAVDFFYPFLKGAGRVDIGFYGGEPLLAFARIEYAVRLLEEKNRRGHKQIEYNVTTNGSRLNTGMLDFFNDHCFNLTLSFDGLAQEKCRQPGSFSKTLASIKDIQAFPGIRLDINSVFSPLTVPDLSASLLFIIDQAGPEVGFSLALKPGWRPGDFQVLEAELARLSDFLLVYYRQHGRVPVRNFRVSRPGTGPFRCHAGREHIAITPAGKLWGCFLFHDYFKTREHDRQYRDYAFGTLDDFVTGYERRYPQTQAHYLELRQELFCVGSDPCFLCPDIGDCLVCPVNAAYAGGAIGQVSRDQCRLSRIQGAARRNFLTSIS